MLNGSETWAVMMKDVARREQKDMRMTRWMCGFSLSDGSVVGRMSNEQVRVKLGIEGTL